jgi:hypothetical protein
MPTMVFPDSLISAAGGLIVDTLVLNNDGTDQIASFDPTTNFLDRRSMLSEANVDLNGDIMALRHYLSNADQGTNVCVNLGPTGQDACSTIAVSHGLANVVTGPGQLVAQGAIRIA